VNGALTWALVISALGVVMVRRRLVAVALVAVQSLWLGAAAIGHASGHSGALLAGGVALVARGMLVPLLLAAVVLRTPEPQRLRTERHPLARGILAVAVALAAVALAPSLGLTDPGVAHAAIGLLTLGITTAVLRRPAIFQVLGFLVAENALYLAALSAPGGLPAFIELGLAFDLVVVVAVAGLFSARIHEELGTGDTSLLGGLRD
jgi:hydrogenase-4 component E